MTTKKTVVKKVVKTNQALISSTEYVNREAFDKQFINFSKLTDDRFTQINNELEARTQYQGKIVSPILWERLLAVFGHVLLAYVVIASITVAALMLMGV